MLKQVGRRGIFLKPNENVKSSMTILSRNHSRSFKTKPSSSMLTQSMGGQFKEILKTSKFSFPKIQTRTFTNDLPPHRILEMPALSPSMEKGNISKWVKQEGDQIKSGDIIAEIETDKATMDWEATDDGFLAKIIKPSGSKDVSIGQAIAVLVDSKESVAAFANFSSTEEKPAPKAEAPPKTEVPPPSKPQAPPSTQPEKRETPISVQGIPGAPPPPGDLPIPKSGFFASPLAKATASQIGVQLNQVEGSGPNGRIIQQDVLGAKNAQQAPAQKTTAPQPTATASGQQFVDTPNSQIRKITAQRLSQSKQTIPHYYLTIEIRVDELLKIRKSLNDKANGEYKLSVNDFLIKASAIALKKVPAVNSSWNDEFIRTYQNVDINVAVNTEKGLFTPIVRDADKIGLAAISETVRVLATKAKENKLQPNDFTGGTFTISNLGMFGIKTFSAVINPPQACILAVGATEERVIVDPKSTNPENPFTVANIMSVTLSCDHRVVDGAIGAQWLQEFKRLMEDPLRLLL